MFDVRDIYYNTMSFQNRLYGSTEHSFLIFVNSIVCIVSGCTFAAITDLHLTLARGSKKSHGYCNAHTSVNGIDLPANLYERSRKFFPTKSMKGNALPQTTCTKWAVARLDVGAESQRSTASPVGGRTAEGREKGNVKRNW